MDNKYEIFSTWWHALEQEELRKYCATGWGWKIWQAITALQNEHQNIPEIIHGWKLVPVEPTRQMMSQGHFALGGTDRGKFRRIYQAMLAAAPEVTNGTND